MTQRLINVIASPKKIGVMSLKVCCKPVKNNKDRVVGLEVFYPWKPFRRSYSIWDRCWVGKIKINKHIFSLNPKVSVPPFDVDFLGFDSIEEEDEEPRNYFIHQRKVFLPVSEDESTVYLIHSYQPDVYYLDHALNVISKEKAIEILLEK